MLSILASFAEEESGSLSRNIKWCSKRNLNTVKSIPIKKCSATAGKAENA